jgi:phosphoheptose isomerase
MAGLKSWGLHAAAAMGLDTTRYQLSGSGNVHNCGANGWYQGLGTVMLNPITYDAFFDQLPRALKATTVTTYETERASNKDKIKLKSHDGRKWMLPKVLSGCRKEFNKTVERGNKLIFIGNGGSAAIASHMAVDYSKNGNMRAIAFNDAPTLTCLANDYGYQNVFAKQIEYYAVKRDAVIVISTSGRSLNLLGAADAARALGCRVITFTGMNPNNELKRRGDLNFWVPSADYGIVELTHLTLLHSIVSVMQ